MKNGSVFNVSFPHSPESDAVGARPAGFAGDARRRRRRRDAAAFRGARRPFQRPVPLSGLSGGQHQRKYCSILLTSEQSIA